MEQVYENLDSPISDIQSVSTQSSFCENSPDHKRDLRSLKTRLKLQALNSSKASFFPSQNDIDNEESGFSKTNIFKKKFQDVYTLMNTIGQGSCGIVKTVLHNEEQKVYAAKIVRARSQEHLEQIKREFQILSKLNHKNIITAKEFFNEEAMGKAQLILEYFQGKTLEELIIEKGQIEEERVRQIIEQVASALKHIHDKGVCHRDISATNILVNENYEVKLIDFSISKIAKQELWSPDDLKSAACRKNSFFGIGFHNFMLTNTGTDYYKAPEVVTGVPYNHSIDMWSLGVVTFYALVGHKPFNSKNLDKLYYKISKAEYKWDSLLCGHLSHESVLFVKACLKQLPFIRLSAKEALYHPWIRDIKLDLEDRTRYEKKGNLKHESPPVRREVRNFKTLKSFVLDFTAME